MARAELAATYGNAIFDVAAEANILEQLEEDLLYVEKMLKEHVDLYQFVDSPLVSTENKIELLGKVFKQDIHELALNSIFVMVKKGRVRLISDAINHFIAKAQDARGIVTAKIYVADQISEAQKEKIIARLSKETGKTVLLKEVKKPSLLGGFVIELGDIVIDSSIRRRLEEMERMLRSGKVSTTEIGVSESV